MKNFRMLIVGLVAGALLATAGTALANSAIESVTAILRPDYKVEINGKDVALKNSPLAYNGTTYIPLREAGEIFGHKVGFKSGTISLDKLEEGKDVEPVAPTPESPVEVESAPAQMPEEDADSIKTSEEQIVLAEQRIKDRQDRIKKLESDRAAEAENISEDTSPLEKQVIEMKISGIDVEIASAKEFIKANEEIILSAQANIEKIKKKYE